MGLSHAKLMNSEGNVKGSLLSSLGQSPPVNGGGGAECEAEPGPSPPNRKTQGFPVVGRNRWTR